MKQLQKIRYFMNRDDSICLFKHAIVPILEYGDFLVESAPKSHIKQLQTVQNKGLRTCLRVKPMDLSTNALQRKCKVERLGPRRKRHLVSLIYKVAQDPKNRVLQNNRTRSDKKIKLKVERPKREKYKKGPLYRGMGLWDQISSEIQKCDSSHIFKAKIQKIRFK